MLYHGSAMDLPPIAENSLRIYSTWQSYEVQKNSVIPADGGLRGGVLPPGIQKTSVIHRDYNRYKAKDLRRIFLGN